MTDAFDPYITNRDSELHLRDARHAHQLATQHNFALAPKVGFLYHVVFEFAIPVGTQATAMPNTQQFQRELSVLVKGISLPKMRADVQTKRQYNRKKNVQTGVNYDEVSITFHDDNTGITRALIEEYYRWYFRDGNKQTNGVPNDFNSRDKFSTAVPRYGMDNDLSVPFFKNIRIYQLSRQKWVSYTLVNPLFTSWQHDDLAYGDGAILENKVSVAYEAVMYDFGDINPNADPAGFTSQETRYDQVPSPLTTGDAAGSIDTRRGPELVPSFGGTNGAGRGINVFQGAGQGDGAARGLGLFPGASNYSSNAGNPSGVLTRVVNQTRNPEVGGLQQVLFPTTNTAGGATDPISRLTNTNLVRNLDSGSIERILLGDKNALNAVINKTLSSGAYGKIWNSSNFGTFKKLNQRQQAAIATDVIGRIAGGDKKLTQIASSVINVVTQRAANNRGRR